MIKDWKREAAEECNDHTIDSHRQRVGRLLNDGGPGQERDGLEKCARIETPTGEEVKVERLTMTPSQREGGASIEHEVIRHLTQTGP
jgi:hypothetical protein